MARDVFCDASSLSIPSSTQLRLVSWNLKKRTKAAKTFPTLRQYLTPMNTPITASVDDFQIRAVAQKLERDRAALMDALDAIFRASSGGCSPEASEEFCDIVLDLSEFALTAARANFPQP